MNYYLAVDIGASSGRCILGYIENEKLVLNEIYRFTNGLIYKNGHLCWDLDRLYKEIINGLKLCNEINKTPKYVGIDTWGVDFVLIDKNGNILGDTVAYRDHRTEGMDRELEKFIDPEQLYEKTGIQKQLFNSIYQLLSIKKTHPDELSKANNFLMIPDYLNYLLTGKKVNEYTNATTTQLVNTKSYTWDQELVELFENKNMFNDILLPQTNIGEIKLEIAKEIGYSCEVLLVASHDTASAVMAVPNNEDDSLYISSGTWSLMGTIMDVSITSENSRKLNFTNSGGYDKKYLYLKNIMGLWLIQEVNREYDCQYSYAQLCELAETSDIKSIIDCSDNRFLSPKSMINEIKTYCAETNQDIPQNEAELSAVIYNSLAMSYKKTIDEFEYLCNRKINRIQIVGGGSQADYLNRKTAELTGKKVSAGPVEATAIGNLICQLLTTKQLNDIQHAKEVIKNSFEIKDYN